MTVLLDSVKFLFYLTASIQGGCTQGSNFISKGKHSRRTTTTIFVNKHSRLYLSKQVYSFVFVLVVRFFSRTNLLLSFVNLAGEPLSVTQFRPPGFRGKSMANEIRLFWSLWRVSPRSRGWRSLFVPVFVFVPALLSPWGHFSTVYLRSPRMDCATRFCSVVLLSESETHLLFWFGSGFRGFWEIYKNNAEFRIKPRVLKFFFNKTSII